MSTHINFRGKMIPASFAVDELKTEKGAQTAVDKWQKSMESLEQFMEDDKAKIANYKLRIMLAKQKYPTIN